MLKYSRKVLNVLLILAFSFLIGCSTVPVSRLSDSELLGEYRKLKSIVSGPIPYVPTAVPIGGGIGSWAVLEAADITKRYTIDSASERLGEVQEEMTMRGVMP
jgi:starvation-inducible outer membrane lipoprotein